MLKRIKAAARGERNDRGGVAPRFGALELVTMTFNGLHRKFLRRFNLSSFLTSARITISRNSFVTPKVQGEMCEISEPWMFDLLTRLLPAKPGTFLDVGVNLGQTLLPVKMCEPSRRYVGVESNAQCFAYAERFIEINGLINSRS
jgi:hypothetical protein